MTSVSMEPPPLVGIGREAGCHRALTAADEFVVNLLGEEHSATTRTSAPATPTASPPPGASYRGRAPVFRTCPARPPRPAVGVPV
ncbi:flavin reductase family protein [Streptomyces sp. NBC_01433]|uniref:flavin reductase family protein n=1 Tax=Streptomyces sp. NBC_01433 TaxID=2903864 RepID=UPI00224F6E9E|nr:flavin reductase family protein [Streptomyces sp. NBC_01433]MCX4675840.1 flavin reductase family protein [Streptomyces sp. NBC_01433]